MSHRGRRHVTLITISAGLFAGSVSSFGADPGTSYSTAIAVPSHVAPAAHRPNPIDPPGTNPDRTMQRARTVDRLYEEVMRSSGCSLAGCGKTRRLEKIAQKSARNQKTGPVKSMGYRNAEGHGLLRKQHRPTFSATC